MDAGDLLNLFLANLPLIVGCAAALGLLGYVAKRIRDAVRAAEEAAAKSPGKLDDVVVAALKPYALDVADLIERGDLDEAKRRIDVAKLKVKAIKRKG